MARKYIILAAIYLSMFLLIGCDSSYYSSKITSPPSFTITVEQLGSQLGLSVEKEGKPYYQLSNEKNRVLLFIYDGGRAYVNGKAICSVGSVTESNGSYYVSELLVPKIRGHLTSSYSPPVNKEVHVDSYSSWKSVSGLVVVDPGHGGRDPGAQSALGYWEKGINLKIAHKLTGYLRDAGIKVVMTRNDDSFLELEERATLANHIDADLFVSIHCNTIDNPIPRGPIVFIAESASLKSKKTAINIVDMLPTTEVPSRGVKEENFRVLVQTKCPAILIECGFMSNYDEAALLLEPWYQDKLARTIANGIIKSL